jgi:signal recognition particle GTPase
MMDDKIQDLSLEELKAFIDEAVDKRLAERLGDPDVGLEVKPEIIQEIRRSRRSKKTSPANDVAQRLGLVSPFKRDERRG